MKIRNGFVSNSSSCSFVIGKEYMTDEQINLFRDFIENEIKKDGYYERETYIHDNKYYFVGDLDINEDEEKIIKFLESIGVEGDKICTVM